MSMSPSSRYCFILGGELKRRPLTHSDLWTAQFIEQGKNQVPEEPKAREARSGHAEICYGGGRPFPLDALITMVN
jgi:hypothetical protein